MEELQAYLQHVNSLHLNIKFTVENELDFTLRFQDIRILRASAYQKSVGLIFTCAQRYVKVI